MSAFSNNHLNSFEDFEGLTAVESFDAWDESAETVDFTDSDLDSYDPEYIQSLAGQINETIAGMSEKEAEAYIEDTFAEIAPTLIPIITALAPVAIQAVSGLISNAMNRPAPPPPAPPPPRPAPVQQTRPAPPPASAPRPAVTMRPAPAASAPAGSTAVNAATLANLMQTPAVVNAIAGVVSSVISGTAGGQAGNVDPQLVNMLLSTVAQLASNAQTELFGESQHDFPEFLFDPDGNLTADPYAPEQMADLILKQLAR